MRDFSKYHPLTVLIMAISAIVVLSVAASPAMTTVLLISGISSQLYFANKNRLKILKNDAILFIIMSLINPIFSHNGVTPLFFLNDNAITLEALLYGVHSSACIIAVICWCSLISRLLGSDKIVYLFGRIAPKTAAILTTAITFIPRFSRDYKNISAVLKTSGRFSFGIYDKIRLYLSAFSTMLTRSLENAIDTSDSMKARGFDKKRRNYRVYSFFFADAALICLLFCLILVVIFMKINGAFCFEFYPNISYHLPNVSGYFVMIATFLLSFYPVIITIVDKIIFTYKIYQNRKGVKSCAD